MFLLKNNVSQYNGLISLANTKLKPAFSRPKLIPPHPANKSANLWSVLKLIF